MTRRFLRLGFALAVFLGIHGSAEPGSSAQGPVHVVRYQGPITGVSAHFLTAEIREAEAAGAEALIFELDTPGGLDGAMRQIVKAELGSKVPIVVYVAPSGSRAASAGVFLAYAAHVAAMAPGTNIGSASPVAMTGASLDSTMARKVTHDAAAYLESIARERGRSVAWARRFVVEAANLPAESAVEEGVVDLIARDRDALLQALDGREILLPAGSWPLRTARAPVVEREMGLRDRLLALVAEPTVAYLLLLLGIYGIFFELSHPGAVLPGVVGVMAILLALFALQALPVRVAGLALLLLGVVPFVLGAFVTGYGLLGLAGVGALIFGSAMLYEAPLRLSWGLIVPVAVVTGGFLAVCATLAVRGQRAPVRTGLEAMRGEEGRVLRPIAPGREGKVVVHGEVWDAIADEEISEGDRVEVIALEGRRVRVRRPLAPGHPVSAS